MLIAILIAALGASQVSERTTCVSAAGTAFRRVALDGDAAARTFVIENPQGKYTDATISFSRTRDEGNSFTMACLFTTGTETPASVWGKCTCDATGVCPCKQETLVSPNPSASEQISWRVKIDMWRRIACTVDSADATSDDLATCVQQLAVTQ